MYNRTTLDIYAMKIRRKVSQKKKVASRNLIENENLINFYNLIVLWLRLCFYNDRKLIEKENILK